jgi:Tol biopolymer transport system component/imidazolonepropionase-like amidohydrolase
VLSIRRDHTQFRLTKIDARDVNVEPSPLHALVVDPRPDLLPVGTGRQCEDQAQHEDRILHQSETGHCRRLAITLLAHPVTVDVDTEELLKRIHVLLICFLLSLPLAAAPKKSTEPAKPADPAAEINKPRADARKVTFPVSEATWMSLDVSPDGSTIVFDLLGDLYTVPVAGGAAKAMTRGPAFDWAPRFSPDGKTISFTSDRSGFDNIWLMAADGTSPRALTNEKGEHVRSANWSPDGNYLVARKITAKRGGIPPVELWIFHVQGGSGVKLTSSDEINNASGATWSADGRYLFFSGRRGGFNYAPNVSNGLWQIHRYDRETGDTTQLTSGYGGAIQPTVDKSGNTMVFVSRRDADTVLVRRDLRSGKEEVLLRGVTRDEQEGFAQMEPWPGYALRNDALFFGNHGKITRLDLASKASTVIPFTAQSEHHFAPRVAWQEKVETGPVRARILRSAAQTPDGKAVVFDAFGRIWMQKLANGKADGAPMRITPDDASLPRREYAPSVSNDGWIAYVTWSDVEGGHVWKTRVGEKPQKLTTSPGHFANPKWSPDGRKLVVIQGSGLEFRERQPEEEDLFDIRWLPATGGEPQFVTSVRIADTFRFHPQAWFNRDGSRLYYRQFLPPAKQSEDPKNELVSIRLDGTDRKTLLRFPSIGDLVPSPDEQWVAFTSRDNVYVAALPNLVMKTPPEVGLGQGSVPAWRLSENAGGYVDWADAGKTITWTAGGTFHRLPLMNAIRFVEAERAKAEKKDEGEKKDDGAKKDGKADAKKDEPKLKVPQSEVIAISLTMPRAEPDGSFVVRNARVITMKGTEVLERADVVVTKNRIVSVGPNAVAPAGAKEIDGSGMTIMPGIIDAHAHLHYSSFEIFPERKWEYASNLAYGVTTVYDPSAPSLDVFAQAEMVEAGLMTGPRVYSSGDVLYGGQQTDIFAEVNDLEDALRQVRRMKGYGARMIKVYQQPGRAQRLWFAEAARREKMLLTAEGAGEYGTDLTMALDGYTAFEHSLPAALKEDAVKFLAASGTHYTPTLLVSYGGPWGEQYFWQTRLDAHDDPKLRRFTPHFFLDARTRRHPWIDPSEYHFPVVARGAADVLRAGGNVSLGAHGQLQGLGVHWELWSMAGEGGNGGAMSAHDALRAATILAADKIGFAPDLGSIESGKLADFIVLSANPLDDIHNTVKAKYVVKNGVVYDADTLAVR